MVSLLSCDEYFWPIAFGSLLVLAQYSFSALRSMGSIWKGFHMNSRWGRTCDRLWLKCHVGLLPKRIWDFKERLRRSIEVTEGTSGFHHKDLNRKWGGRVNKFMIVKNSTLPCFQIDGSYYYNSKYTLRWFHLFLLDGFFFKRVEQMLGAFSLPFWSTGSRGFSFLHKNYGTGGLECLMISLRNPLH